jgi:hypothetical protein
VSFGYSTLGFGAHPRGGGGSSTLLYDTFTDSDQPLTTHTPDIDTVGGGWTAPTADFSSIVSNEAKVTATDCINMVDVGATDVTIEVDGFIGAVGRYCMLIARGTNAINSGWRLYCLRGSAMALYENGDLRATGTISTSSPIWYNFKMVLSGTSIKCYQDDVLDIDYTISTTESYGNYIGVQANGTNEWDNILVTAP